MRTDPCRRHGGSDGRERAWAAGGRSLGSASPGNLRGSEPVGRPKPGRSLRPDRAPHDSGLRCVSVSEEPSAGVESGSRLSPGGKTLRRRLWGQRPNLVTAPDTRIVHLRRCVFGSVAGKLLEGEAATAAHTDTHGHTDSDVRGQAMTCGNASAEEGAGLGHGPVALVSGAGHSPDVHPGVPSGAAPGDPPDVSQVFCPLPASSWVPGALFRRLKAVPSLRFPVASPSCRPSLSVLLTGRCGG
ncbi:uncharacterized protein LOC116573895 [Mustela erminea]|uniref:uncharacterized protein LOC116573895 n=1 Tax=Mustela erminea TaxID=36723 RepID=UPI00138708CB|nr:uncharacterized protein LOC116573895 [Mustela erminea]